MTSSASPRSTKTVSKLPRAGCHSGMFKASKLYQADSTSGPSATVKPIPTNTSSRRSRAWVTRWSDPRRAVPRHSVRSSRSASNCALSAASARRSRVESKAAMISARISFSARPVLLRCSAASEPSCRLARESADFPAEKLNVKLCQRFKLRNFGQPGVRLGCSLGEALRSSWTG